MFASNNYTTGLNAASSIGDDLLQMESQGTVTADSFTHGSSVQRVSWFERDLEAGDINSCNTFEVMVPGGFTVLILASVMTPFLPKSYFIVSLLPWHPMLMFLLQGLKNQRSEPIIVDYG